MLNIINYTDYLKNEEQQVAEKVFNVRIDYDSSIKDEDKVLEPNNNIKEFGVLLSLDTDGGVSNDVLDLVINYTLAGVAVIIEVPYGMVKLDAEDQSKNKMAINEIMALAHNLGANVAIIPSDDIGNTIVDSQVANYSAVLVGFTEALLSKKNFTKQVLPISGYIEYLFLEEVLNVRFDSSIIKDEFLLTNYVNEIPEELSDKFKESMKKTIYGFYGSKEEFLAIGNAIIAKIYSSFDKKVEEMVEKRAG